MPKWFAGLLYNPNVSIKSLQIANNLTRLLWSAPKNPANPPSQNLLMPLVHLPWYLPKSLPAFYTTQTPHWSPCKLPQCLPKLFATSGPPQNILQGLPWCLPTPFDASGSPPTIPSPSVMLTKILLTPLVHPQQYRVLPWCLPKSFAASGPPQAGVFSNVGTWKQNKWPC